MAKGQRQASARARAAYHQLSRTFLLLDRWHERWLADAGSNGARFAVLAALAEHAGPMTPSAISAETGRSPNAISPLLRALRRDGLIERSANTDDRRSHYLALTDAGRRLAERLQRAESAFIYAALRGRSARELSALRNTLSALEETAQTIQRP